LPFTPIFSGKNDKTRLLGGSVQSRFGVLILGYDHSSGEQTCAEPAVIPLIGTDNALMLSGFCRFGE
jgi:hypothetical protein